MVENKCEHCNKIFLTLHCRKRRFCTKECYAKSKIGIKLRPETIEKIVAKNSGRKSGKYIECSQCKKVLYKYPKDLEKNQKTNFCGFKCMSLFRKGMSMSYMTQFRKGLIPWNKGKPVRLSPKGEFKKGMIPWNKGLKGYRAREKNNKWKGGVTPLLFSIRESLEYKSWRTSVFKRDNYTCIRCGGESSGNIQADHIKPFSQIFYDNDIKSLEEAVNCFEFWDISNGQTLCKLCHLEKTKIDLKSFGRGWKKKLALET